MNKKDALIDALKFWGAIMLLMLAFCIMVGLPAVLIIAGIAAFQEYSGLPIIETIAIGMVIFAVFAPIYFQYKENLKKQPNKEI